MTQFSKKDRNENLDSKSNGNLKQNGKKRTPSESDSDGNPVHLQREIGLVHGTGIMMGIMIGSGIFVSPTAIIKYTGSIGVSLIVWVVSGYLSLLISLAYTELACIIPKCGGEYAYIRYVLGPLPGFLVSWVSLVIVNPAFSALLALTCANYLLYLLYPDCSAPYSATVIVASLILVTVVFLNCTFIRYVTRVQTSLAAIKIGCLILIIIVGIIQFSLGKAVAFQNVFEGTNYSPGGIAIALQAGVFTYGGWQYMFNLMEEVKNPSVTLPRVNYISFTGVIIIYTLVNIAYFTVMTPMDMINSKAVAQTFAERTLGVFSSAIPFFVACSTIGSMNGATLGGSRMYFAAARDGLLPSIFSLISIKFKTPIPSVILTCFLALLYILTGDAVKLIEYLGFVTISIWIFVFVSLIYLKKKKPDMKGTYRLPIWLPIFGLLVVAFMFVLCVYTRPVDNGAALLITISGIPVYLVCVAWKKKPAYIQKWSDKVTQLTQKLLLCLPDPNTNN